MRLIREIYEIPFKIPSRRGDKCQTNDSSPVLLRIVSVASDTIVPHMMSERAYLKNKDHVQYELFEGVEHGLSYIRDTERYRKLIIEFLKE